MNMLEDDVIRIVNRVIDDNPRIRELGVKVDGFGGRFEGLEVRIESLEVRIESLEVRTERLEVRIERLEATTLRLEEASHRHGILLEEHSAKFDRLIEVVLDINRKVDSLQELKPMMQHLLDRQDALEHAFRRHVRNRRAHRSIDS